MRNLITSFYLGHPKVRFRFYGTLALIACSYIAVNRLLLSRPEQNVANEVTVLLAVLTVSAPAMHCFLILYAEWSGGRTRVIKPPGSLLLAAAGLFSSREVLEAFVEPIIGDMQEVYCEALSTGQRWKAKRIRLETFWTVLMAFELSRVLRTVVMDDAYERFHGLKSPSRRGNNSDSRIEFLSNWFTWAISAVVSIYITVIMVRSSAALWLVLMLVFSMIFMAIFLVLPSLSNSELLWRELERTLRLVMKANAMKNSTSDRTGKYPHVNSCP